MVLTAPTEEEKKSPNTYIENRTTTLLEMYKTGKINIDVFSQDLAALDSISNLINLRTDLKVDPFGFSSESKKMDTAVPKGAD